MNALIVEDEKSAQEALKKLIAVYCPDIDVIGVAATVEEGLNKIAKLNPDLVFLDIQLGTERSFQILENLPKLLSPHVVFVTAYSEYAVQAFEFAAVDYLLKPIDPDRLITSVEKVQERVDKNRGVGLEILVQNLREEQRQKKKIVLSTMEALHVIEVAEIVTCQSNLNYTIFTLVGGKQLVISKTLKEFESQLTAFGFVRVHRSWLINQYHITGYDKRDGGFAIMSDKTRIPVSKVKKDQIVKMIKELL